MIACVVDDKFLIATYMFVLGVLSIFPPGTNGETFIDVDNPVEWFFIAYVEDDDTETLSIDDQTNR